MPDNRGRSCPPFAFFFLHACTAWPVGVVGLALGSSLVKAGVPVHQAAGIIAAMSHLASRSARMRPIRRSEAALSPSSGNAPLPRRRSPVRIRCSAPTLRRPAASRLVRSSGFHPVAKCRINWKLSMKYVSFSRKYRYIVIDAENRNEHSRSQWFTFPFGGILMRAAPVQGETRSRFSSPNARSHSHSFRSGRAIANRRRAQRRPRPGIKLIPLSMICRRARLIVRRVPSRAPG